MDANRLHGDARKEIELMKLGKYEDLDALPIALQEGVDYSANIIATYVAQYPARIDMREMAQAMAVEQSTGTWTPGRCRSRVCGNTSCRSPSR
ncbi:MAG: hypothetical protein P8X64_10745 [Anaerolineales bacterium]